MTSPTVAFEATPARAHPNLARAHPNFEAHDRFLRAIIQNAHGSFKGRFPMACPAHDSLSKKTEMAAIRPSRTSDEISAGVGLCLTTARLRLPKADADRFDRLEQERNYVTSMAAALASSLSRPPARPVAPAAGAQLQLQGFPYRTPDSARLQLSRAHVDASVVVPHMADRAHVLRFEPDSLRLTT